MAFDIKGDVLKLGFCLLAAMEDLLSGTQFCSGRDEGQKRYHSSNIKYVPVQQLVLLTLVVLSNDFL